MVVCCWRRQYFTPSAVGNRDDGGSGGDGLCPLLNAPNPYWANAAMRLQTHSRQLVRAEVYNVHGQLVGTVQQGVLDAGVHELSWSGRADSGELAGTGIYYLRVAVGSQELTRKLLVIR